MPKGTALSSRGLPRPNEDILTQHESNEHRVLVLTLMLQGIPRLPALPSGTGVAGNLCAEASAAVEGTGSSPPLVVLLRFCSEGDNTPDAIAVAQAVNESLRLLPGGDGGEGSPAGKPWSPCRLFLVLL